MEICKIKDQKIGMPNIFCHYRKIRFTDYNDILEKCNFKRKK